MNGEELRPPDHPLRAGLIAEMHARPPPEVPAPSRALFLALRPRHRSERDRAAEHAALARLAAAWSLPEPAATATQWSAGHGAVSVTWEGHTEFVSLLIRSAGEGDPAALLPAGWLAGLPGFRIAAARFEIRSVADDDAVRTVLAEGFRPDSLAASRVLDDQLVVAGDFRPDPATGEMRFAVLPRPGTGADRIGRVVQRLCEIETYRAMAMLGFARARELGPELSALEGRLSAEILGLGAEGADPAQGLETLLEVSARLEQLETRANFRFSATTAYENLVLRRISVLREARFDTVQTFSEFMTRRFDPAMRTVSSTERRLAALTERATRAGDLLRTQVEVARSEQNRALLQSMDRRADQALRLQRTVEGLSVVAVSYYAVGLGLYLLTPLAEHQHWSKALVAAAITPVVVLVTWLALRRVRRKLH